jgi:transposase
MSPYTIQPQLSPELAERYEAILQALSGATTVRAAAEKLGLSRVQTHTLLNRAAAGVLESLLPKKSGRRAMPERERKLQQEVERLRKENARLQDRVETIDRLMGVASGILHGQVRTSKEAIGFYRSLPARVQFREGLDQSSLRPPGPGVTESQNAH